MNQGFHIPVLAREVGEIFSDRLRGAFLDGTGGVGGHGEMILDANGEELMYLVFDLDPEAVKRLRERFSRFGARVVVVHGNYARFPETLRELGISQLAGALLDLGVSSDLLDGDRGFSFREDTPLDMRMDTTNGPTAREVLAVLTVGELEQVLLDYADIRRGRVLAQAIHQAAVAGKLNSSGDLKQVVCDIIPTAGSRLLARIFQSVRIQVNDELGSLRTFLEQIPDVLQPGGRLAVISFHSLEDRMVKQAFRTWAQEGSFKLGVRKPLTAGEDELQSNSRASSAKLRWVEKAV